jgi:hypothetical protein
VKPLLAALAAVAALALPSLAFAGGQTGITVKVDVRSGLVAVVDGKGAVSLLHAPASALQGLRPGRRVAFDAKKLRNGTYSVKTLAVAGAVRSVHVRGMIFAVDAKHASFALSAHGAVLPLKLAKHARVLSTCTCPHVNSTDDVTLKFGAAGQVDAAAVTQIDPTTDVGAIDGTVSADAGGKVTVTSGGYAITVLVPAWFDPSTLAIGEHVIAYFVRLPDGSYAISAVANDGSADQADDPADEEGDMENIDNQVDLDEQSDEQADNDQTGAQLAQNELAADQASISNELHELAQSCSAHVDNLKAAGASQDALAAATAGCQHELAAEAEQAHQDLQDCEQEIHAQLAGDPAALQQLAADEQQAESDLQTSEHQDEQDTADGSFDAGTP